MGDAVLYTLDDGLARIRLNRPDSRNALSWELVEELIAALHEASVDTSVRAVLLTAEGKAFCAGMDLKAISLDDHDHAARFGALLVDAYRGLLTLPVPLLCAVDGPAMGGAVGLAIGADILWVGERGLFAFPETKVGIVPALVSVVARRRMTPGKLAGMLLAGISADPAQAVQAGLAEFAVEGRAEAEAEAFAKKLLVENSAEAMRRTKTFMIGQFSRDLDRELSDAATEFRAAVATRGAELGRKSFRSKTKINWQEAEELSE